ncbi:urea ABC transporter, permease protein UrtB [Reinekea forsetii]|uniref:Urea ABC transporter, permease protein UrtB n=3 Tax=Reinekea TaxID=230494 RepID=A0A2K8KRD6_9GAMM|nr:urea ABC transporter, permease protein UrtB [Reinekea forsetii]
MQQGGKTNRDRGANLGGDFPIHHALPIRHRQLDQSMFRIAQLTKFYTLLSALLFSLSIGSVHAESRTDLYEQLTGAKLSEVVPILKQLEDSRDENFLSLIQEMVDGNLYYDKTTLALRVINKVDGVKIVTDPLTGATLEVESGNLKKIRVNNSVRVYIRGASARVQLTQGNAKQRFGAVRDLFAKMDADTLQLITELRVTESSKKVQGAMDLVIAMDQAKQNADPELRVAAINLLATSLEPDVRNLLTALADPADETIVGISARAALEGIEGKVAFYNKVDTLFFGLSLGSVLLLAAIGLAITFGVMGVINMAHGEMIMLGAYTTYVIQLLLPNAIDISIWVAIPAAFLVSGAMGVLIERTVIRFLHGRPLETLLATFGISLILQQLVRTIFSPLNRQVNTPSWMSGQLEINPVLFLTLNRFYIFVFALLVFVSLVVLLNKTNLGLHVRAVSQNRNMARAMGIKTAKVDALTFGLGSGIAGIAGVALSQLTNVGPNLGQSYIIDSFMVVVFGGVGNLLGTLVAAFTLGIANKIFEPITGAVLASILVLVFIILFIQKRPQGLFPQRGRAAE